MLEKAPSSSSSQTAHSDLQKDSTMIETRRLFLAALITAALGLGTAPLSLLRVTMMTMMTIVASVLVATVETMTTMMMMIIMDGFSQHPASPRPCWVCRFGGVTVIAGVRDSYCRGA